MFFSFYLHGVINRASAVLNRSEWTKLREWSPSLHVAGSRHRNLVRIRHRLQMRSFRARISKFQADRRWQRMLHREVPALVIRRVQTRIQAGHAGIDRLAWVQRRETLRYRDHRLNTITHKRGFIEEGQVVGKLQRSRSANLLPTVEDSIGSSNHQVGALPRRPGKSDSR